MGFLGVRYPTVRRKQRKRPRSSISRDVTPTSGSDISSSCSSASPSKRLRLLDAPTLDTLPVEILEYIFVQSENPEFVFTNRAIFDCLGFPSRYLCSRMLSQWIAASEVEEEIVTETESGTEEDNLEVDNGRYEMTTEEIERDIQDNIHHTQTFHIDDMVVEPEEPEEGDKVVGKIHVDHLKWKFVTSELLTQMHVLISGETIPSTFGSIEASERQKSLLPLLKQSGLQFDNHNQVLAEVASSPSDFKQLVSLELARPTISTLIEVLRPCSGSELLEDPNNLELLPIWLIKSGYFVDALADDTLWNFLLMNNDKLMIQYFLALGVVPSEHVLYKFPSW